MVMQVIPGEDLSGVISYNGSALTIGDDVLWRLGTDGDQVFLNNSAGLTANTALTNVLLGTPVVPAIAANSLIIANRTASGDILIAGNLGGNSRAYLFVDVSADTMDLMTAGVSRIRFNATGLVAIGDTSDANITTGLVINQGAADNEILAFKSSDVAHGVTLLTETDTYGKMSKAAAAGGLDIEGIVTGTGGLFLVGNHSTDSTDKTTAATAALNFAGYLTSGTGRAGIGANGNIMIIRTGDSTTRFIFDQEGSAHADIEWVAFDDYDDLLALDQLQVITAGTAPRLTPERYGSNPLAYNRERFEEMGIIGRGSWHEEDGRQRQMVNFSRLAMLHHGSILQLADRTIDTEARLAALETENIALRSQMAALAGREAR